MPNTNDKCEGSGNYRSQCIDRVEQQYTVGETFQACPKCKADVEWVLMPSRRWPMVV